MGNRRKYIPGMNIGPYNILFIRDIEKRNGFYIGEFQCPECDNFFISRVNHVVNGSTRRCKECRSKNRTGFKDPNFKNLTGKRFGKLTVIKYNGSILVGNVQQKRGTWLCKCDCGNEIILTTNELTMHKINSCSSCKIHSDGEWAVKTILEELYINYIPQYRFKQCKDKKPLPFDFYLPDYNICIEYDGISHYKPNKNGSWNTLENVTVTQEHDKIKTQFCKDNNIKLIRIPYWERDEIDKEYLKLKLNIA